METTKFIKSKRGWIKRNRFDLSHREEVRELTKALLKACEIIEKLENQCHECVYLEATTEMLDERITEVHKLREG